MLYHVLSVLILMLIYFLVCFPRQSLMAHMDDDLNNPKSEILTKKENNIFN